jgi:hypothetical protein
VIRLRFVPGPQLDTVIVQFGQDSDGVPERGGVISDGLGSAWAGVPGLPGMWTDALAQAPQDRVRRGKGRVGPYDGRGVFIRIGAWMEARKARGEEG